MIATAEAVIAAKGSAIAIAISESSLQEDAMAATRSVIATAIGENSLPEIAIAAAKPVIAAAKRLIATVIGKNSLQESAIAAATTVSAADFFADSGQKTAIAAAIFSNLPAKIANWTAKRVGSGGKCGFDVGVNPQFRAEMAYRAGPMLHSYGMTKLITGYTEYSADDLGHLGESVANKLPKIDIFSALKPTPAEITVNVTALQEAIAMYGPGRKQAIEAAFDALAGRLGEVAVNAPQIPNVTDTDLAEIGLPVVKTPQRATNPPDAPQNLRLFHGQMPGEITGKCDSLGDAIRVYEAQWTLDPNGNTWSDTETFPNSRSFKFSGLARGKDVWVRVRARNAVGVGPWSDPATIMVT